MRKLFFLFVAILGCASGLALASKPAWGAIAFVRSTGAFSGATSGTSESAPAMVNGVGDFLYVSCRAGGGVPATTINSVTDTSGNTYTAVDAGATLPDSTVFRAFFALNIAAATGNVVTCNYATSKAHLDLLVDEYSGVATAAALCTSTTGNTTTAATSFTSAAFTTCEGGDLIAVGATTAGSGLTYTAGVGYTIENSINGETVEEDQIPAGVLTNTTASITASASKQWGWTVAVFKIPAVAAAAPHQLLTLGIGL